MRFATLTTSYIRDNARGMLWAPDPASSATLSNHHLLDSAHNAMRSQHWALAARMFDAVLAEQPQSVPARTGRARCAMLQSQPAIAVGHLHEAARCAPENAAVARSLGVALLAVDSLDAAATELQRARMLDPQDPLTRLHIGQVRERQGQMRTAAQSYYRALVMAQGRGQWLDRARTPAPLQPVILHAMDVFIAIFTNRCDDRGGSPE